MSNPVSPNGEVLVGRDAFVYTISPMGADVPSGQTSVGNPVNMLGVWKDIEIKWKVNWAAVTPSSALEPEKRRTTIEWEASLSHYERGTGSVGLDMFLNNDRVMVMFTESASGRTIRLVGGLSSGTLRKAADESMDNIDIESVGSYNGGLSISYV